MIDVNAVEALLETRAESLVETGQQIFDFEVTTHGLVDVTRVEFTPKFADSLEKLTDMVDVIGVGEGAEEFGELEEVACNLGLGLGTIAGFVEGRASVVEMLTADLTGEDLDAIANEFFTTPNLSKEALETADRSSIRRLPDTFIAVKAIEAYRSYLAKQLAIPGVELTAESTDS